MVGAGLDSELCWYVNHASANTDCDLCPDESSRRDSHCAISDHQAYSHDVNACSEDDIWLVVFGVLDEEGNDDRGDRRGEGEGLCDSTGGRH